MIEINTHSYSELQMPKNYIECAKRFLAICLLPMLLFAGNSAFASLIEYKVDLFGPGFHAKYPTYANLESWGKITGKYNDGVLSGITGTTTYIDITEGYIASGYNQYDNYIFGKFNDDAPASFKGKDVFLDLSRGADYEETIVTESIIREWAWALFVFDDDAEWENEDAKKDRHHSNYHTIRKQYKTFDETCSYYGSCNKAGGEFFGHYGKRIPDTPVPLPAAFYFFAAGLVSLVTFSRNKILAQA